MNAVSFAESLGTQWTQCGALWQACHQRGADFLEGKCALRRYRAEGKVAEVSLLPGETSGWWI